MAFSPYNIFLRIQYPSGTNLANVNVTLRNESTNESHTETTNSSGEVGFNIGDSGNFPSGWEVGDVISWVVMYSGYETSGSHTTVATEGGYTNTAVVLTAVPTAPSLRYFTPQEFLDYFNLDIYEDDSGKGIKMQQLVKIGQLVEADIDSDCNTIFDDNDGSGYSFTEYIDTDELNHVYFIKNRPIYSITNLYTTQNDEESAPVYASGTWDSLTENTHYYVDTTTGRLVITNSTYYPITRNNGIYVVGTYGRSTTPLSIKQLAMIDTAVMMGKAELAASKIHGKSANAEDFYSVYQNYRRGVISKYQYRGMEST
jgi:hypothetical protein